MGKVLSADEVSRFRDNGIHFPVNAFSADAAATLLRGFEQIEAHDGGRMSARTNKKPHLLLPWLAELIRSPKILDAVEDVLGPDILCWSSQFFAKDAHDPQFISWHQDATYWGLSSDEVLTVWVALTPSTVQSGCMRVVPGTHKKQVEHRDTFESANMLSRGQEIAVDVREEDAVNVVLQPGQFSMHSVLLFHGSEPNRADHRRIGYAIRYVPTRVRQTIGSTDSATLVRGVDRHNHFEHELPPVTAFDAAAVERHRLVTDRQAKMVYSGAAQQGRMLPEQLAQLQKVEGR
jgi:non-heme Fe2+,alpha-ketoglutarate-dependent halogenase